VVGRAASNKLTEKKWLA